MISIREFIMENDLKAVEELELSCDVSPTSSSSSKPKNKKNVSLSVNSLGDPLCRVRHVPDHIMLVAEHTEINRVKIVGVIRACVKNVTSGVAYTGQGRPSYVRVAYILGLRVSSKYRRLGIGTKLVERAESWCIQNKAKYAYIATDKSNTPSLNLFTTRLSYTPFRSLTIRAQPVHSHSFSLPSSIAILKLPTSISIPLCKNLFSNSEFFPSDIDSLLTNHSTLGTFIAVDHNRPSSFAMMSLWSTKNVFHLKFCGASTLVKKVVKWTRKLDETFPCMKVPSIRNVFRAFGIYLMYGTYVTGERGSELMKCLSMYAHNMAMEDEDVAAVVCEVGLNDCGVKDGVLGWKRISCEEDVWCMKKLVGGEEEEDDDWIRSRSTSNVIFVDPREF